MEDWKYGSLEVVELYFSQLNRQPLTVNRQQSTIQGNMLNGSVLV